MIIDKKVSSEEFARRINLPEATFRKWREQLRKEILSNQSAASATGAKLIGSIAKIADKEGNESSCRTVEVQPESSDSEPDET